MAILLVSGPLYATVQAPAAADVAKTPNADNSKFTPVPHDAVSTRPDAAWTAQSNADGTSFTEDVTASDDSPLSRLDAENDASSTEKAQAVSTSGFRIPEPTTLVLFGTALLGFAGVLRIRK